MNPVQARLFSRQGLPERTGHAALLSHPTYAENDTCQEKRDDEGNDGPTRDSKLPQPQRRRNKGSHDDDSADHPEHPVTCLCDQSTPIFYFASGAFSPSMSFTISAVLSVASLRVPLKNPGTRNPGTSEPRNLRTPYARHEPPSYG